MKYAIIDIETSGGSTQRDKITEIAIFVHDGEKIIDQFQSLINPECGIPYFITGLTGITNEMVADAPKFYEVARQIVEMTEGCIFVAHNVSFDYNFVRGEFRSLGYEYKRETLDTVRLSRKLLPGHKSYSLGKLCDDLKISLKDRHRAAGDALATVKLFELLLKKQQGDFSEVMSPLTLKGLHENLDIEKVKALPKKSGVYYLYNEDHELIYIGKSKEIRSRIFQHLNNTTTEKAMRMRQSITSIDYECTGSELIALLKESQEIKENKPIFNRAQRRSVFNYGLYSYLNDQGYLCLKIEKSTTGQPITTFHSQKEAKETLFRYVQEYRLCQKHCGLYDSPGACFQYSVKECEGACIGEELTFAYNMKVEKLLEDLEYDHQNILIVDKGRHRDEKSLVLIEHGKYQGYGFAGKEVLNQGLDLIRDCIHTYNDNRDIKTIIRGYLKRHKVEKIIPF